MSKENDQSLALIDAIGRSEASESDIAAQLRSRGIDSLEGVIGDLRQAMKTREELSKLALRPVQVSRREYSTPPEFAEEIVQYVPEVAVLLNGTIYDPKDITRFNGQELHMVVPKHKGYLIAIDDHAVIASWHTSLIINDLAGHLAGTPYAHSPGYVHPSSGPSPVPTPHVPQPESIGSGVPAPYSGPSETVFFEHDNSEGSDLRLDKNRGFYDLTDVHSGLFGWGSNWNDRISSLQMWNTGITVLHEHIKWTGQTLTLSSHTSSLRTYGWNDRASSVETW